MSGYFVVSLIKHANAAFDIAFLFSVHVVFECIRQNGQQ